MTVAEQLVAPPQASRLLMSRRTYLRLVKTPRYDHFGVSGQKVGEFPGETIAFKEGRLDLPLSGMITLEDGRQVPVEPIAEWLFGNEAENIPPHRLLNDRDGGFWEVDVEAPPVSQEEMHRLMQAAIRLDEDMLEEVLRQEREGWERKQILEEAQNALDQIRDLKAQAEAATDVEPTQKAKPGPKPKATTEA